MAKLFFFDLETTGTDYTLHGIHQFSGLISIDGQVKESFNWRVMPHGGCAIDPVALQIGRTTPEQLAGFPDALIIHASLCSMMSKYVDKFDKRDKFHLVGYNNASFDNSFLRKWFDRCRDNYFGSWFWSSSIDVMVLAAQKLLMRRHEMKDFKLATVAEMLGVKIDEAKLHDAMYDIELTMEVYERCIGQKILQSKPQPPAPPAPPVPA